MTLGEMGRTRINHLLRCRNRSCSKANSGLGCLQECKNDKGAWEGEGHVLSVKIVHREEFLHADATCSG